MNQDHEAILEQCYQEGRSAYPGPERNIYGMGEPIKRSAWSDGYHDSRREAEQ